MKYPLLVLLLALAGTLAAQPANRRLDSLEATLPQQPDSLRPHVMYQLALGYRSTDTDRARHWAQASAAAAQRIGRETAYADALSVLGMLAKDAGDFKQAIQYQTQALRIHDRRQDQRGIMICNNDIGIIYKRMKLYRESIPFFERVVAISREQYAKLPAGHKNKSFFGGGLAYGLGNLGTAYYELRKLVQAKTYHEQALAQARKIGNADAESVALTNLGILASERQEYATALSFLQQALALDQAAGNEYGQIESLINIGQTSMLAKQPAAAERALQQAARLGERLHVLPNLVLVYSGLADLYSQTGQPQKAVSYYQKLQPIQDSLYNEETTQQVAELQTKYETEKKEAQNRLLNKQKQLQAAQLSAQQQVIGRRNTQLLAGGIVAALLLGLAYLLYNRRRLQQKVELEQERQRLERLRASAVLEAEEAERRRIGSDLHDGVGQLLTAAKMNLHALGEELNIQTQGQQVMLQNALDVVDESFREVRSISHNLMPNALIKRGLAQAVRDFLSKIAPDGRLKVQLEVVGLDQGGRLDPTVENVLFRVIQELVQNIVKHAQASQITLQIIRSAEDLTIMVEDNGVGFDPAALGEEAGIGLKNIESRMAYLGGRADFDTAPGRGTTVTLEVPN
jgi:two-component system NarL family sensor kinase